MNQNGHICHALWYMQQGHKELIAHCLMSHILLGFNVKSVDKYITDHVTIILLSHKNDIVWQVNNLREPS